MDKKLRVVVIGTGNVASIAIRSLKGRPDMELVGVADLAPTLSIRALKEQGMPYDLYLVEISLTWRITKAGRRSLT